MCPCWFPGCVHEAPSYDVNTSFLAQVLVGFHVLCVCVCAHCDLLHTLDFCWGFFGDGEWCPFIFVLL